MTSKIHPVIILSVFLVTASCFAVDPAPAPPYQAKVLGDNVSIFSKPSTTDSYVCGTVSDSDTVTVVRIVGQWSKIMPVEGCFSWISSDYIDLDQNMPNVAMVTGNSVNVWAGSDKLSPLHSTRKQTLLNKGELVTLLGEKKDGYYKIVPPVGAYLWIQNKNIEYSGAVASEPIKPSRFSPVIPPAPASSVTEADSHKPEISVSTPFRPADTSVHNNSTPETKPSVVVPMPVEHPAEPEPVEPAAPATIAMPSVSSIEAQRLKECYAIKDQLDAECKKPLDQQYYAPLIEKIQAIIDDPNAGKARGLAEYEMKLVNRYQFAVGVNTVLNEQDKELNDSLKQIKADYIARTATIPVASKYTVTGVIKPSQIYTDKTSQQRFVVVGDDGKIICYALPNTAAAGSMAKSLEGKKVGINGSIGKDPVNAISVVRFSQITEIEQ